jgi:ABC-type dipeptide/oligopeptide/nickel transport system ATPase component
VLVMYAGHLVEEGRTEDVLQRPKHPYTRLLVSAVPDPRAASREALRPPSRAARDGSDESALLGPARELVP